MDNLLRKAINGVTLTVLVTLLLVSHAAIGADRVNTMMTYRFGSIEPWQVTPGVSLAVFGNATDTGSIPGDGTANGDTYTFSFSANANVMVTDDGSLTGAVGSDKYIAENVTFTLLNGSTREIIEVTLTVDDGGGSVDSDTREIDIVDPTDVISDTPLENLAIEVNIAIQDGLRAAYLAQAGNGSWPHGGTGNTSWICGTTGFTVWAFANSGHLPTNDVDTDIYAEFVQKGVDYILSLASLQVPVAQANIGDPDGDANGRMVSLCGSNGAGAIGYSSPIAATSVIAAYSAAPGTLATSGALAGDSYLQIIQDAIDWIAFAQHDGGGVARGGWRYNPNGGADTSSDSWSYVANEGFEAVFGGTVLELVKQEAERRLNSSQSQGGPGNLGQFGYAGTTPITDDGNATTGGGLSGLAMVTAGGRVSPLLDGGVLSSATFPDTTTRIAAAVAHLGLRWDVTPGTWRGNRGNFYATWTQARALRLNGASLLVDKNGITFDWETGEDQANPGVLPPDNDVHEGYFPFLVRTQAASGHWAPTVNTGNWTQNLNTAWGILTLQPTVFGPPAPIPVEIDLSPDTEINELSADNLHEVTAHVTSLGVDREGVNIDFAVTGTNAASAVPGAGSGTSPTDVNGEATFTYTVPQSCDSLGTDTITGCTNRDDGGEDACDDVTKDWVDTTLPVAACVETVNPHGNNIPKAPGKGGKGQNQDGFYELLAEDDLLEGCAPLDLFVTDDGSGTVFGPFPFGTKIKYTQAPGVVPGITPMGGNNGNGNGQGNAVDWHIKGNGDALLTAVDQSGNISDPVSCLVPPPPK